MMVDDDEKDLSLNPDAVEDLLEVDESVEEEEAEEVDAIGLDAFGAPIDE
jgi:hypothetical protein